MHRTVRTFLEACTEARTVTDVNIAAGLALEELVRARRRSARRTIMFIAATVAAFTLVGDVFASSPVHAGIVPRHAHVFTHLGLRDWSGHGPSVFGHPLPWRGWREVGG